MPIETTPTWNQLLDAARSDAANTQAAYEAHRDGERIEAGELVVVEENDEEVIYAGTPDGNVLITEDAIFLPDTDGAIGDVPTEFDDDADRWNQAVQNLPETVSEKTVNIARAAAHNAEENSEEQE